MSGVGIEIMKVFDANTYTNSRKTEVTRLYVDRGRIIELHPNTELTVLVEGM